MATYPGPKVHRYNRRKLGRGQYPTSNGFTATLTNPSADVIQMVFSRPVVVTGTIPLTSSTGAFVSQTVINATTVQQTWSTSQAAATVTLPQNAPNVTSVIGGGVAGQVVTF
jgi:hypothetical protein